jgi:hypothetical protein
MRQVLNQSTSKSSIDLSAFLTIGFGVCTNTHSSPVPICVPSFCVYVFGFAISPKLCDERLIGKGGKQPANDFMNPYGKDNLYLQLATGLCTKEKHNTN